MKSNVRLSEWCLVTVYNVKYTCAVNEDSKVTGPVMESRNYWEDNGRPIKYENCSSNDGYSRPSDGNLSFVPGAGALAGEDDMDFIGAAYLKKGKVSKQQDPMLHRIIEKRRRDRMNNCLADLSRLIPPDYCKKGRGRVEKTEIIEMAIRHLKHLQDTVKAGEHQQEGPIFVEHFRLGYQECRSEVMRYLVETQGYPPADPLCVQLVGHLDRHCDSIVKGDQINYPRSNPETSNSSRGSGTCYSGDKPNVAQAHNLDYRKRTYEYQPHYTPSPDPHEDYITLPYYEDSEVPVSPHAHTAALRNVRKLERDDGSEHAHSYKFKNTIKQRFASDEAHDMTTSKRRRPDQSSSASTARSSSSNDEGVCRDASLESSSVTEPRDLSPHLAPEPPPMEEKKTTHSRVRAERGGQILHTAQR